MQFKLLILVFILCSTLWVGCSNSNNTIELELQRKIFENNDLGTIIRSWDSICTAEKLDTNSCLIVGVKAYKEGHRLVWDNKTEEAKPYLNTAEASFEKIGYNIGLGYAHLVKAYNYQRKEMSDSTLWHFTLAKNIFSIPRDTMGMIIACNNLGIYLFELGALSIANDNYLNARDFTKPETVEWLTVEYNIANYLIEVKDTASIIEGRELFLELLKHEKLLDSLTYSNIYNGLATVELKFKNGAKAEYYIQQSMRYQSNAEFDYIHIQQLNRAHSLLLQKKMPEYHKIMDSLGCRYDDMSLNGKQHFTFLWMFENLMPDLDCLDKYIGVTEEIQERGFSNKLSVIQ